MNKNLLTTVLLFLFSVIAYAQNSNPESQNLTEFVFGIPKANEKTLPFIKEKIGSIKGMEFKEFCPEHNLFLVLIDESKTTREKIIEEFSKGRIQFKAFPKSENFISVRELCNNSTQEL